MALIDKKEGVFVERAGALKAIVSGPSFCVSSKRQGWHTQQKNGNSTIWSFQFRNRTCNHLVTKLNALPTELPGISTTLYEKKVFW